MKAGTKNETQRRLWALGLLGIIAVFVAFVRLRLADFPLERDEGEYAYFAQLLLQGVPPYAEAYSMKMPGTYAAYALVLALFGETAFGIRLGLLVVNLGTMYLVFALGRRLVDESTGAVAGAVYGLMSLSISVLGFAAHATHFVALFAAGGLLLLLRAIESRRTWLLAASGALLGLAYTMKQHGVVFAAFGAFWLLVESRGDRTATSASTLRRIAVYCAGAVSPFVVVVIALSLAGVFDRFWFWNFDYARGYATSQPMAYALTRISIALGRMQPLVGFGALAVVGLLAPLWDADARRPARFLGSLLVFSTLAALPGGHFRHHYFIPMWPAVALLAGLGWRALALRVHRTAAAALLLTSAAYVVVRERAPLLELSPFEFSRAIYRANPFPESIEVAKFVKANTAPDDRVAVFGSEPQIFFYSGRRSASGHIYTYGLTEQQPYSRAMQNELFAQVEAARPALVVLVDSFTSWLWAPGSEHEILDRARSYLAREYERVGVVEISATRVKPRWGDDANTRSPASPEFIEVFERRDRSRK